MRWDHQSPLRLAVSLFELVVGGFLFATTEPSYYLHLPAVLLILLGSWGLVLAVVPRLRAEDGTPHRRLILAGEWAVFLVIVLVVVQAAFAS